MNMKGNLKNTISDPKSRVFFFLMIAVIVIVLIFAYISKGRVVTPADNREGVQASSNISNPSAGIKSIPGISQTSTEYQELQRENEKMQAEKALTDIGQPSAALPSLQLGSETSTIPGFNMQERPVSYNDKLNEQLESQRLRQQDLVKQQQEQLDKAQTDARNKQVQALLGRQTQLLAQNWQTIPQQYVEGSIKEMPRSDLVQILKEARNEGTKSEKPKIFYKAGDILFGVILTAVNSDEPGPVLARIISGPLSNSKIIGNINTASIPKSSKSPRVSESLILEFNLMNIPGSKHSVPVMAVAIDPETARTSLATSVDHHYLMRYGTFFASAFLSGLGQAVSTQNQSRVITDFGTTVNVGSNTLKSSDEMKIAVGKTAEALSDRMDFLDVPPTIKVASGTAIGILLQQDVIIGGDDNSQSSVVANNIRSQAGQTYQQNSTRQMSNVYGTSAGQSITVP